MLRSSENTVRLQSDRPRAAVQHGTSDQYYEEVRGSLDNTRSKLISARYARRRWTGAMQTSENSPSRTFVNKGKEAGPELLRPGPALLLSPHPRSRSSSENSLTSAVILSPRGPPHTRVPAVPMPQSARPCRAGCNG